MEKSGQLIRVIYGYVICLVSVVVVLISVSSTVSALINLQDPLRVNDFRYSGPISHPLSSYEAYKQDVLNGRAFPPSDSSKPSFAQAYTPSEAELHAAYDAAKTDRIAAVELDAKRSIVTGIIMVLLAIGLFISHARWLTRLSKGV